MNLTQTLSLIFEWIGNVAAVLVILFAGAGLGDAINKEPPHMPSVNKYVILFCMFAVLWAVWWVGHWW